MGMFKASIGDLFASHAQTLVNTVNCVGVMGKGVALEFKKRWPAMFEDYRQRCAAKQVRLGEPYLYRDAAGASILNFPTKDHWRSPSRIADIESGLDYLVGHAESWGIRSLALPPLGCGNGGLDWSEVGPLIYRKLHGATFDVTVYAPFGTPAHQLTDTFLAAPAQMSLSGQGRRSEKLNPDWVALVEVLREVQAQPYANPIGRTIFQKLCYVLTEMGVPTGFQFGKGSYGPFSADVKPALHEMANRNWLLEKPLGRMVALTVGPQYEVDRTKFLAQIETHQKRIAKTVDLFSRIKSTEQAEEVLTVLYASRQVKQAHGTDVVTEEDIYNYILEWKKAWHSDEKHRAVANAIRNLVLLGWMRAQVSEKLIESA
jgi:O-acetyl-ADP-ribose deacetylase (regulator of RNase III)/uncharacterized protein YwgA